MTVKLSNALLIANYAMAHANAGINNIAVYVWIDGCAFSVRKKTISMYDKDSVVGAYNKEDIVEALNALGTHTDDIIASICYHDDGTKDLLFSSFY